MAVKSKGGEDTDNFSISSRLRVVLVEGSIHRLWPKNIEPKLRSSNSSEMANGITASTTGLAVSTKEACIEFSDDSDEEGDFVGLRLAAHRRMVLGEFPELSS